MRRWGGLARAAAERVRQPPRTDLVSGAVVVANVRANGKGGKSRPGILIDRREGFDGTWCWSVLGLTTLPAYADGKPREPIRDWAALGLTGPGFYWGPRLPIVPEHELGATIGHVPPGPDREFIAGFLACPVPFANEEDQP